MKWRALAVWILFPYMSYFLFWGIFGLFSHDVSLGGSFDLRDQAFLLSYCVIPAVLGTLVLWLLPIRHALLGIPLGIVSAFGWLSLVTWIQVILFGGFEESPGIIGTAMVFALPICLAGAYAGYLRAKDRSLANKQRVAASRIS
jgi:hypothetical protein